MTVCLCAETGGGGGLLHMISKVWGIMLGKGGLLEKDQWLDVYNTYVSQPKLVWMG